MPETAAQIRSDDREIAIRKLINQRADGRALLISAAT